MTTMTERVVYGPPIASRAPPPLPPAIAALADQLAQLAGSVSVVLGGSRAMGTAAPSSDWDLGVYYRGDLDLAPLRAYGDVHPPGSWGRIMNGGAWLTIDDGTAPPFGSAAGRVHAPAGDGTALFGSAAGRVQAPAGDAQRVDIILRDLDVVETWSARAHTGGFEIDLLLGYLAGIPTYSLLAELAVAVPLRGPLPVLAPSSSSKARGELPPPLAASAPPRWRFHRDFSLEQARARARRGDLIGATGQCARAIIEHGHAVLCARRQWVLNEKHVIERAGLGQLHGRFTAVPHDPPALTVWVEDLASALRSMT